MTCELTYPVRGDFHLYLVAQIIGYRCDNRRFWLSAQNCQVPTPTSQNLELNRKFGFLEQIHS
jgi:hypothetical protein